VSPLVEFKISEWQNGTTPGFVNSKKGRGGTTFLEVAERLLPTLKSVGFSMVFFAAGAGCQ
jgi:hypothetical protein